MKAHPPSTRFIFCTESIDFKKLERESRRLLYLGFVVAVAFHAMLASLITYKRTEVTAVRPIEVELIVRPPRMTRPFMFDKKAIVRQMLLKKRFITRLPSGEIRFESTVKPEDIAKIIESLHYDLKIDPEIIAAVIAEIDSTLRAGHESIGGERYFSAIDTVFQYKVTRKPDGLISLREEFLSADDLDTGQYMGVVIRDLTDKQKVTGFVHIPLQVWGTTLESQPTVIGLMYGLKKYTGIKVVVDKALFIDSPSALNYPFIYIAASGLFDLSPREKENMKTYFLNGGFLLLDPFDVGAFFSMRQMIEDCLEGRTQTYTIPKDHPIYRCFFDFEEPPALFPPLNEGSFETFLPPDGVWFKDRLIAVMPPSPSPLGAAWSDYESDTLFENPSFRMAVNTIVFALIREGSIAKNYINTDTIESGNHVPYPTGEGKRR